MQEVYTRKQTTTQTLAPEQKPHNEGTLSNSARCAQHEHSAQETRDSVRPSVTRVHRRVERTGKQGVRERGQYLQLAFGIGATAVDSGNDFHIRRSPGRRRLTRKRVRVP